MNCAGANCQPLSRCSFLALFSSPLVKAARERRGRRRKGRRRRRRRRIETRTGNEENKIEVKMLFAGYLV